MPSKNYVVVIAEDEAPIRKRYADICRDLGLKVEKEYYKPEEVLQLKDGEVCFFKNYKDADAGLKILLNSPQHRVKGMVTDQVLETDCADYISQDGPFGTTLIKHFGHQLSDHQTHAAPILLRTAEDGMQYLIGGQHCNGTQYDYAHKPEDRDYKAFTNFMIPVASRISGIPTDTITKALIASAQAPGNSKGA